MRIDLDRLEELRGKFSRVYGINELSLGPRRDSAGLTGTHIMQRGLQGSVSKLRD